MGLRSNPTLVHFQARHLDRPPVAAQNRASFRRFQIPVAYLGYGHSGPHSPALGRRVLSLRNFGQSLPRHVAGDLDRQPTSH